MIYLFNNNEEMIRIIPNSAIKRMYQTQTLTDENYISDRLDVEIQALNDEELSELEYMAVDDIENPQRFHYYFIVKETTEHQITSLTGVQSGIEELRKTPVYDMRPTNLSPKLIADRLLEGTNWQAGYTTDDVGTISTNFYYTDVFSALKKMCMAFGIEMQFFVEITTNRIGARYIEFRKRTGKSVGKRVVYGHNALKIVKEVEKTNTVTALIGRGRGVQVSESDEGHIGYGRKIGFENVEWKISSGAPVDKPLGQEFVEIPELTLQYGIKNANGTVRPKIGFVEFQDEESETRLIDRTYNALLELSRPQVLLETSSVYLPDTGIGDTVNVVRHDRDLRYQTRVFEITWDRLANQAVDMKLGDRLGESENKRISRISNQVSGNISTELGSTIEELADRLTSADRKNTNWYTDYDPMKNPDTMGLVRVNDNWYQPDPEYEGEFILKQWNGEMWVEILRTSGNPEVVRRVEEAMAEAEQAKQEATDKANQALADAKAHADAEVQASKERFDALFEEVELDVADAQETANSAVEQIDTAVSNAGFTSLDETIQNMNDITMNAGQYAQQAITNASNAYELAQTSISEAQTAQANALSALSKADNALDGVSSLDFRVDEVEGELELKADNTFINEDGTLTTLSNAITFNADRFSRDMSRIESRVELLAGEINLVILRNAFENTWLLGGEVYPNATAYTETDTMSEMIDVVAGEELALSKNTVSTVIDNNTWRISFYDNSHNYVTRTTTSTNQYILTVPAGATKMWVSYPKNSKPQIVRGTDFIPYRPNMADQLTTDEMVIFRNEYDEYADRTERRLSAIDSTGGSLDVLSNEIITTAERVTTDMTALIDAKVANDEFTEFYQNEYLETAQEVSRKISLSDINIGTRNLILNSDKPADLLDKGILSYNTRTHAWPSVLLPDGTVGGLIEFGAETSGGWLRFRPFKFETGKAYTFSFWARRSTTGAPLKLGVGINSEGDSAYQSKEVDVSTTWQRFTFTAKINRDVDAYNFVELRPPRFTWDGYARYQIWRPQLERANVVSDWKEAPEDTNTRINHIQTEWTQTFNSFEFNVSDSFGAVNQNIQDIESSISTINDPVTGRLTIAEQTLNGFKNEVYNADGTSKITQLATGVQSVVTNLNELEVGGRNLIKNSDKPVELLDKGILSYNTRTHAWPSVLLPDSTVGGVIEFGTEVNNGWIRFRPFKFETGKDYTFSFWAKRTTTGSPLKLGIGINSEGNSATQSKEVDVSTTWQRFTFTAKINRDVNTYNFVELKPPRFTWDDYARYQIWRPQLEKANVVSDWKEAPEDTQSQISQLANNINLRVAKGELLSQINIEADRTLIQSNRLVLDANSVVFTGNAFIPSAQIQSLHADKINAGTINSARINASEIVTKGLTADVVTATHIKSDNALIDNIFANQALVDRLWSKEIWTNKIKAMEIDAGKITTGTLNAANVNIVNLDVNKLTGNAMNFISGAFTSNAGSLLLSGNGIRVNFSNGYNLRINGAGTNYYTSGGQPIGGLLTSIPSEGESHTLSLVARRGYAISMGYQGSLSYNQSYRALSVNGTTGNITVHRPIYESSSSVGLSFLRVEMGNVGWGLLLSSTKAIGSGIFLADNGEVWIGIPGGYKQFT